MPLLALIALFLVVPFVEPYVILEVVGPALGAPLTILCSRPIPSSARSSSSRRAGPCGAFNSTMAEGKVPHREVVDGVLVIFGGAFLITPGFVTDIAGSRCCCRPREPLSGGCSSGASAAASSSPRRRGARYDVEGSAREYEDRRSRGSSGERSGAGTVLLRPRSRHTRDGAVGHDDPVRGKEAGRAPRGARGRDHRRRLAGAAGRPALPSSSSRSRGRGPRRRARLAWPASRARPPGGVWTASARSPRQTSRRAGRSSTPSAPSPRSSTSSTR